MQKLILTFVAVLVFTSTSFAARVGKPNILIITVDDMSCDSVGVFGCAVADTTPTIDRLASQGLRFHYAHVQTASCMPSRNVMFSGRYSHNNKVEGFYQVQNPGYPVLADLMREAGYFTAILHKVQHSTPYSPYKWDMAMERGDLKNARFYGTSTRDAIEAAKKAGKAFCLNVNIADPHKPFYAEGRGGLTVPDPNVPTLVFKPDDIRVPGFLPDDPIARKELAHYYSSVRRADDCLAEVLKALDASGQAESTLVLFLSDHGMPLPFAKTQVYHHSTRTPWIIRWPGVTEAGLVDRTHMISAIDLLPTLLDIAGITHPKGLEGRSFLPLIKGETQESRDMVFKHHNENSGGHRNVMRAVETKTSLYIFNPWANGSRVMGTATAGTPTWRRMVELAKTNREIAARVDLMNHRVLEEFYDVSRDPDCLKNLIKDPLSQPEIARLRKAMGTWMKETRDPLLHAFEQRGDPEIREAYITKKEKESAERLKDVGKGKGGKRKAKKAASP